ncbi:XdhC family protein [Streptomyces bottropensis]|uniref:XdhC family protein n=1 Tax=Streptomyces bottropensis TaxID=42235 RepID=UPI002FF23EEF
MSPTPTLPPRTVRQSHTQQRDNATLTSLWGKGGAGVAGVVRRYGRVVGGGLLLLGVLLALVMARLRSPIGLDIGALTPEETAISITSEITAHTNRGTGRPLSHSTGPIHVPAQPLPGLVTAT